MTKASKTCPRRAYILVERDRQTINKISKKAIIIKVISVTGKKKKKERKPLRESGG